MTALALQPPTALGHSPREAGRTDAGPGFQMHKLRPCKRVAVQRVPVGPRSLCAAPRRGQPSSPAPPPSSQEAPCPGVPGVCPGARGVSCQSQSATSCQESPPQELWSLPVSQPEAKPALRPLSHPPWSPSPYPLAQTPKSPAGWQTPKASSCPERKSSQPARSTPAKEASTKPNSFCLKVLNFFPKYDKQDPGSYT